MIIRLFYSNKCQECMNLCQVIFNEGIVRMFIPVCLDNFNSKQIASLSIKQIPAIVVSAENQQTAVFEGPQQCSAWLTSFTLNRRRNIAQRVEEQRRLIQKNHAIARAQEGGPSEYTEAEMDGVSDSYSYNGTELCQPKNYVMVGTEESCAIPTPQVNHEGKIDMEDMRRRLADLESARKADNQQYMSLMEQNQIKAVVFYNPN
jgi:hypothetical protein